MKLFGYMLGHVALGVALAGGLLSKYYGGLSLNIASLISLIMLYTTYWMIND